jgi:hypothetical protein
MDPVQRIPRYTLLFRTMVKHMAPGDPQRPLLMQADEFASKIALAEMDDQTKRAAVIHCLCATVDNFPPALISNSRRFIDCIDVEDLLADTPLHLNGGHPSNASSGTLHATLILFDDKLMILKRPGNGERSGRALAGLDELEKVTKTGGLPLGMKKNGLSCKGVMDILDVVATDVGSSCKPTDYAEMFVVIISRFLKHFTFISKPLRMMITIVGRDAHFALFLWYILQHRPTWSLRRQRAPRIGSWKVSGTCKLAIEHVSDNPWSCAPMNRRWNPSADGWLLLVPTIMCTNVHLS